MSLDAHVRLARPGFELDVALEVAAGDTVAVIGPNGAGKSTLLRALAGLEAIGRGHVTLDGVSLAGAGCFVAPEHRPVGMVFQTGLLFPHLRVVDNVAFGLRARHRVRRAPARAAARDWLARVGLSDRAAAFPSELSGGQAQRVALARALCSRPRLLLLDEPLAAADAATRTGLRRMLIEHLRAFDGVALMVTHDVVDARALADRFVVIEAGRIVQTGSPDDVTAAPRSTFVAELVGTNWYAGEAAAGGVVLHGGGRLHPATALHGPVYAVISPRAVALHRSRPEGSPRNVWSGVVDSVEPLGERVRVRVDASPPIVAEITRDARTSLAIEPGAPVYVSVKATEIVVSPA